MHRLQLHVPSILFLKEAAGREGIYISAHADSQPLLLKFEVSQKPFQHNPDQHKLQTACSTTRALPASKSHTYVLRQRSIKLLLFYICTEWLQEAAVQKACAVAKQLHVPQPQQQAR